MSKLITVSIVTPVEVLFKGESISVIIPAADGYMEFLQAHAPLVTPLGAGSLTLKRINGERLHFYVDGGYAEIHTNKLTVLADHAERMEQTVETETTASPLKFQSPESSRNTTERI